MPLLASLRENKEIEDKLKEDKGSCVVHQFRQLTIHRNFSEYLRKPFGETETKHGKKNKRIYQL